MDIPRGIFPVYDKRKYLQSTPVTVIADTLGTAVYVRNSGWEKKKILFTYTNIITNINYVRKV